MVSFHHIHDSHALSPLDVFRMISHFSWMSVYPSIAGPLGMAMGQPRQPLGDEGLFSIVYRTACPLTCGHFVVLAGLLIWKDCILLFFAMHHLQLCPWLHKTINNSDSFSLVIWFLELLWTLSSCCFPSLSCTLKICTVYYVLAPIVICIVVVVSLTFRWFGITGAPRFVYHLNCYLLEAVTTGKKQCPNVCKMWVGVPESKFGKVGLREHPDFFNLKQSQKSCLD